MCKQAALLDDPRVRAAYYRFLDEQTVVLLWRSSSDRVKRGYIKWCTGSASTRGWINLHGDYPPQRLGKWKKVKQKAPAA